MSLEQQVSNGANADRLMQELQPHLLSVQQAIVQAWEASPVGDIEGQHELRLMRKLLNDLEANIHRTIHDGKLARIEIERDSIMDKAKVAFRKFR
jgi:hypothetical protein